MENLLAMSEHLWLYAPYFVIVALIVAVVFGGLYLVIRGASSKTMREYERRQTHRPQHPSVRR
jgi:ABC-type antimicrobial peptide transport system permease subunit